MSHRDAPAICRKIDAALDYMGDDEDQLRPYLVWQLDEIMSGTKQIGPDDCTTSELMALLAVLAPIFARGLTGTAAVPTKLLTLIIGGDGQSTGT